MPKPVTTLCLDDDTVVLEVLRKFLISEGHQVIATASVQDALKVLDTAPPLTFCISDYQMPEMSGDDFLKIVAEKSPDTIRVLMSSYANRKRIHQATLDGVCDTFVQKPFSLPDLIHILDTHRQVKELNSYTAGFSENLLKKYGRQKF